MRHVRIRGQNSSETTQWFSLKLEVVVVYLKLYMCNVLEDRLSGSQIISILGNSSPPFFSKIDGWICLKFEEIIDFYLISVNFL